MPIKPLDFQITLPRTFEASKLQNDYLNKNYTSQQLEASKIQDKALEKTRLVQKREDTYKVTHREHRHEQQDRDGKKQGSGNKSQKEQKHGINQSIIDIRL